MALPCRYTPSPAASVLLAAALCGALSPSPAAAQGAGTIDSALAAETFDTAWTRVRDTYYDPAMGGLDWDGIRRELRPRAAAAGTTQALRDVIGGMLARLGDSHLAIIPGASAAAFELPTSGGEGDPGLDFRWIEGELLVSRVRSGSGGEGAGIRSGWAVEEVEGIPIDTLAAWVREGAPAGGVERHLALWLPMAVLARMAGPEGSQLSLRLRDASDRTQTYSPVRTAPPGEEVRFGNLPPLRMVTSHRVETLPGGMRIGIVRLSAWFPGAVPAVAAAVEALREADGIILDLRGNPGGLAALAMGIGGHFLDEPLSLGTMRTRDTSLNFVVNPQRVTPEGESVAPYAGPLAILIDPLTASTSEVFAGGMKAIGRARIFGEPSAGQALPALVSELPNGDRLLHAVADFTAPDGSRLEGAGVAPDVLVPPTRAGLLEGLDAPLDAAMQWILSSPPPWNAASRPQGLQP